MAIIKDAGPEYPETELELAISMPAQFDPAIGADWVIGQLVFRFGKEYPEIVIEREGQTVPDMDYLIEQIRKLEKNEIRSIDFEPLEPDYEIHIEHSGIGKHEPEDNYKLWAIIDAIGAKGGAYSGVGPALVMYVNRAGLRKFADDLEQELISIKKGDVYLDYLKSEKRGKMK